MSILSVLASSSAEAADKGGLPQLDASTYPSQLFWLVLTFGGLYFLMAKVFLPKLGQIIEERQNRIADDLDQAAELKRQAEEAEAAYNQALADAKANAASIAAETRADLVAKISEMQAETDSKLATQIEAAEARIAEMRAQAAAKVKEAAVETTKALVEVLIDESPSAETVKSAVNNAS